MHPAPKTHNETNQMQKQHHTKTCSDGVYTTQAFIK